MIIFEKSTTIQRLWLYIKSFTKRRYYRYFPHTAYNLFLMELNYIDNPIHWNIGIRRMTDVELFPPVVLLNIEPVLT